MVQLWLKLLTLWQETKLYDHDKDNWWHLGQANKSLDTENKFPNPIWIRGQNTPD